MRAIPLALGLCVALLSGCAQRLSRHEFARVCMGVRTRIIVYASDAPHAERAAQSAFAEVSRLDAIFSDYRDDSEAQRLCRAKAGVPHEVSPDLLALLVEARRVGDQSMGAFDVTVGPLTRLWREARRTGTPTDARLLADARARVGPALWTVDERSRTATMFRDGMGLDFGGIAKGYAAEQAAGVLRSAGLPRCLVALAGDVYAGDPPPGADGWRVEIRGERAGEDAPPVGVLLLANAGVSTSGDAEQSIVVGGERLSHIMDPRTGRGVTRPRTVTVVASHGARADAAATALGVLGAGGADRLAADLAIDAVAFEEGKHEVTMGAGLLRWAGASDFRGESGPGGR